MCLCSPEVIVHSVFVCISVCIRGDLLDISFLVCKWEMCVLLCTLMGYVVELCVSGLQRRFIFLMPSVG